MRGGPSDRRRRPATASALGGAPFSTLMLGTNPYSFGSILGQPEPTYGGGGKGYAGSGAPSDADAYLALVYGSADDQFDDYGGRHGRGGGVRHVYGHPLPWSGQDHAASNDAMLERPGPPLAPPPGRVRSAPSNRTEPD